MVAGPDACHCPHCDTTCKGKFAGCVDVWARGPRAVTVLFPPTGEPVRRSRSAPTVDEVVPDALVHLPPPSPEDPAPRRLDDHTVAVIDQLVDKVQTLEAAVAVATQAPRPAPVAVPPPDDGRIDAVAKAVGGLTAGLDRLGTDVNVLREVPDRLEALERRLGAPDFGGKGAGNNKAVERLASDLARLSVRIDDVSNAAARSGTSKMADTLARLSARVEELDKARSRLEAAASSAPSRPGLDAAVVAKRLEQLESRIDQGQEQEAARLAPLQSLVKRVAALEAAEAPEVPEPIERLSGQVATLAAQVSALEGAGPSPESSVQLGRVNAMEKVLAGLVHGLERISGRVNGLDDVPKRLEALESTDGPSADQALSVEKVLSMERAISDKMTSADKAMGSMGKRLDRLSTQVGELKSLPERVRAVEVDQGQAETLARGLGGAIDMIDQLSAQVAAIENGSPPPPLPSLPVPAAAASPEHRLS